MSENTINKPNTFEEAIDQLSDMAYAESAHFDKLIAEGEDSFTATLHMHLGMWIRNNWGLWGKDGGLYEHFTSLGIGHADDMSNILLTTLYRRHTHNKEDIDGQVESYKEYWTKHGIDPLTQEGDYIP